MEPIQVLKLWFGHWTSKIPAGWELLVKRGAKVRISLVCKGNFKVWITSFCCICEGVVSIKREMANAGTV
jgi:hypothetical protein